MHYVFQYATYYGIMSESDYPLQNKTLFEGEIDECHYRSTARKTKVKNYGFTSTTLDNCMMLARTLEKRTATAAITANNFNFLFYGEGIINACGKEEDDIDHAVHVVGYESSDAKGRFWVIKNSWGTSWGEEGFAKIDNSQNDGNMCRVCFLNSFTVL